ncbi:hypothetical protein ACTXT7_017140 [Hymenolepis weldensis]
MRLCDCLQVKNATTAGANTTAIKNEAAGVEEAKKQILEKTKKQEQSHVEELQTNHQMVGRKSPENSTELKNTQAIEVDCDAEASTIESNSLIHGSKAAK